MTDRLIDTFKINFWVDRDRIRKTQTGRKVDRQPDR